MVNYLILEKSHINPTTNEKYSEFKSVIHILRTGRYIELYKFHGHGNIQKHNYTLSLLTRKSLRIRYHSTFLFSGDRVFPPQTGLTYSTWICVEKYSDPRSDPHCVRLLTLVRNISNSRDEHLVCLTVVLSARDKAIIVSTQETLLPHSESVNLHYLSTTLFYQLGDVCRPVLGIRTGDLDDPHIYFQHLFSYNARQLPDLKL